MPERARVEIAGDVEHHATVGRSGRRGEFARRRFGRRRRGSRAVRRAPAGTSGDEGRREREQREDGDRSRRDDAPHGKGEDFT